MDDQDERARAGLLFDTAWPGYRPMKARTHDLCRRYNALDELDGARGEVPIVRCGIACRYAKKSESLRPLPSIVRGHTDAVELRLRKPRLYFKVAAVGSFLFSFTCAKRRFGFPCEKAPPMPPAAAVSPAKHFPV